MTISTYDQLIAALIRTPRVYGKSSASNEAAGIPHTPWYAAGITGAGAAPGSGLNGAIFTGPTLAGQIPMPAAVSGKNSYLSRWSAVHAGGIGFLQLVDRLWGNVPTVTTTTAQSVTSPAWPARDNSGSSNGDGVLLALECSSATGNSGAITNTVVSYTNSAGTSGRTATVASFPATAVAGSFVPLTLQAGDTGVRSVQSITLGTSYVSGAVHLIAYRPIADLPIPSAYIGQAAPFSALNLPIVWDASVLQLVCWPTGTTVGELSGQLAFAQG